MKEKTYTLELTASELDNVDWIRGRKFSTPQIACKLYDLAAQARADKAANDLRLPWRWAGPERGGNIYLVMADGWHAMMPNDKTARLCSAAPELLEAVKAAADYFRFMGGYGVDADVNVRPRIERALRKVETGVPE